MDEIEEFASEHYLLSTSYSMIGFGRAGAINRICGCEIHSGPRPYVMGCLRKWAGVIISASTSCGSSECLRAAPFICAVLRRTRGVRSNVGALDVVMQEHRVIGQMCLAF